MNSIDPRVEAYMSKAAGFAQPILTELRRRVHAPCPEVEKAIKWRAPAFLQKGKILAMMVSFKQHVACTLCSAQVVAKALRRPKARVSLASSAASLTSLAAMNSPAICTRP